MIMNFFYESFIFLPDGVSGLESDPVGDLSVLLDFLAESLLQFESFDWSLKKLENDIYHLDI